MSAKEFLDKLLIGFWEKIVVQGGELERSPTGTAYLLSGIWIYCLSNWIEISAIEVDDDEYCLSVSVLNAPPIPEPSRINNPPRELLRVSPIDCKLDKLSSDGVKSIIALNLEKNGGEILSKSPIIIQAKNGNQFEIAVSDEFLGSICLKSV